MAEIVDLRGRDRVPAAPPVLADPSGRRARVLARAGRIVAIVFVVWLAGLALAGLGILPAGDVPLAPVIAAQSPPRLDRVPAPRQPTRVDLAPALPATGLAGSPGAAVAQATLIATSPTAGGVGVRIPGSAGAGASARNPGAAGHRRGSGSGHRGPGSPAVNPRRPAHGTSGSGGSGGGTSSGSGSAGGAGGSSAASTGASHGAASSTGAMKGKATAPGQTTKQTTPATGTTSRGSSSAAPGQVKQPTTTPTPTTTSPGQSASAPGQTVPHGGGHGNGN